MNSNSSLLPLVLIIIATAAAVPARLYAAPAKPAAGSANAASPAVGASAPAPAVAPAPVSPMQREIEAALEQEKTLIEELNHRFREASLPGELIAIQKQIETTKKNSMITVYEIQLRYAEVAGKTVTAEQLRTTIEAIRNPKPAAALTK